MKKIKCLKSVQRRVETRTSKIDGSKHRQFIASFTSVFRSPRVPRNALHRNLSLGTQRKTPCVHVTKDTRQKICASSP